MLIIHHNKMPYQVWKTFITLCQVFSSYMYCMLAAYRKDADSIGAGEKAEDADIVNQPWFFWLFEVIFLVDMIVNFFLDFQQNNKTIQIISRDIREIVHRYVHGEFLWDLVPLIPLQYIEMENNLNFTFYLVKVVRLRKGFGAFTINQIVYKIKEKWQKYIEWKFNNDLRKYQDADDDLEQLYIEYELTDHNQIEEILYFSFFLKTLTLFFFIFSFSYFFAMFFRIILELERDLRHNDAEY